MKCIRVQTSQQEVTQQLSKAEQNINMQVIANHARTNAAQQAYLGNYRQAQSESVAWQKYMDRNAETVEQQVEARSYAMKLIPMNNMLQVEQSKEHM